MVEGDIDAGKRYEEKDFNKIIEIKEREAYRVKLFMGMIDQREKTIVFGATQAHHHFSDPEWDGKPLEPECRMIRPTMV